MYIYVCYLQLRQAFLLTQAIVTVMCWVKGPQNIDYYVGEDANLKWTTTDGKSILSAIWGIREGNSANPHFINVNGYTGKVNFNSDLDPKYKSRINFTGNLKMGRAWFVLRNLTINDTIEYIASISENASRVLPYPVRLVVKKRETISRKSTYFTTSQTILRKSTYFTTISRKSTYFTTSQTILRKSTYFTNQPNSSRLSLIDVSLVIVMMAVTLTDMLIVF